MERKGLSKGGHAMMKAKFKRERKRYGLYICAHQYHHHDLKDNIQGIGLNLFLALCTLYIQSYLIK